MERHGYRRRSAAPRRRISEVRFDTHRDILEPLIDWIGQQGRLPEPDEFAGAEPVIAEFGSLKRAFALTRLTETGFRLSGHRLVREKH